MKQKGGFNGKGTEKGNGYAQRKYMEQTACFCHCGNVYFRTAFNASDIAIVGNFAQTDKTAAVAAGANSPIIGLILNLFIGIALGANVVIANAIGRDDKQTVKARAHFYVVVSVIGGVLVAIIGELIAEPLLTVLNVPDDVLVSHCCT